MYFAGWVGGHKTSVHRGLVPKNPTDKPGARTARNDSRLRSPPPLASRPLRGFPPNWLVERLRSCEPVEHYAGSMEASVAVGTGWLPLRGAMRSWGVHSREELPIWLRRQGFPGLAFGNHISARAQEFILIEGCSHDGRVTLLEFSLFYTGRTQTVENPTIVAERSRVEVVQYPRRPFRVISERWASLDGVQVEELFVQRMPMLKSCFYFS